MSASPRLGPEERHRILVEWNDTATPFPDHLCLHELFEAHVETRPTDPALLFRDLVLSYAELERRANQLAHHLGGLGIGRESLVGLCADRSVEMVVGILGILKAGAAYVPMEATYPKERLAFMLEDTEVPVLLTQERLCPRLPAAGRRTVIALDRDWGTIAGASAARPRRAASPENLAYVIYTSGSTGRPKGIALQHRGVVNNVCDLNQQFGAGPQDRTLAISSLSFDMCVYEVLGALAMGGAIVMPEPDAAKDPAHWAQLVRQHRVTIWNSAPPLLEMLVDCAEARPELRPECLRVAILGGDWVRVSLPGRFRAVAPGARVIVLGGATEASIHSIIYHVGQIDPAWPSIPYGRPMANQRAYILGPGLEAVAVGEPGELHLGGVGLARGYFRRPELTAERFLVNPFGDGPHDRIYKTGDLARWLPDGNIQLLGRMDDQVKIRGHRIELQEIAATLKQHPTIQDALVVARDIAGDKQLVAYAIPAPGYANALTEDSPDPVEQWRAVYDATYSRPDTSGDPTLNFVGWESSYTGLPFPDAELREMLDVTVDRILALGPKRVLEIGCGTGLLLFRVGPRVARYDATDFSGAALAAIEREVARPERGLGHVRLWRRDAADLGGLEPGAYDTVILNSVAQHFPDADYLRRVLEGAARVVRPGGTIFVGDVRSRPLLEAFHTSIELHRAPNDLGVEELRERIRRRLTHEKELAIHPGFFASLPGEIPSLASAAIRLKRGRFRNEMSAFHYDAILMVGAAPSGAPATTWVGWEAVGASVERVWRRLSEGRPEALGVTGVPNARVWADVLAVRLLRGADAPPNAAAVREAVQAAPGGTAVDPEALAAIPDDLPYTVHLACSADAADGRLDAVFLRRDVAEGGGGPPACAIEQPRFRPPGEMANTPLHVEGARHLVPQLVRFLAGQLPEYMVPRAFVFMDAFPVSPNGKVDRRALPVPGALAAGEDGGGEPPRTAVELMLAGLWCEVLGLARVGREAHFFNDLGGHSLTAAQVIARLGAILGLTVPLRAIFEMPTIAGLAAAAEAEGAAGGVDVVGIAEAWLEVSRLSDDQARALLAARGMAR